jgi:hypothetical protein
MKNFSAILCRLSPDLDKYLEATKKEATFYCRSTRHCIHTAFKHYVKHRNREQARKRPAIHQLQLPSPLLAHHAYSEALMGGAERTFAGAGNRLRQCPSRQPPLQALDNDPLSRWLW